LAENGISNTGGCAVEERGKIKVLKFVQKGVNID